MKNLILLLAISLNANAQLSKIISNMFFDLPLHSDVFTIRERANANSDIHSIESDKDYLSGSFYLHSYISEMPIYSVTPYFRVQFENGESFVRSLSVYYSSKQANDCLNEYNNLIKKLTPYFKRIEPDAMYDSRTKEKIGTGKKFFALKTDGFYTISIGYTYRESNEQYELQIVLWEKNVWQQK